MQAFKATTPYSVRLVKKEQTMAAPKRLTGLQTLLSLGWRNPLRHKESSERAQAQSQVVGLAGGPGSGLIPPPQKKGPANRHRAEVKQAEEVHPRHAAIKQVLRIPPDPGKAVRYGDASVSAWLCGCASVSVSVSVWQFCWI